MTDITQERWASLREQRSQYDDIYEQVVDDFEHAMIGVSSDGRLHLLIAIDVPPSSMPPDLQGLQVRLVEDDQFWIDVSARSHHEELLTLAANRIIYSVRTEGRGVAVSVERVIGEMRSALRPLAPDLSASEQIGLFGELWVLSNVLMPTIGTRVCHLWSGPESERHDFVGERVHVEVKTTTKSEPKHEISRLDQLRAPNGKRLLFISVLIEKSLGGDETIADRVDEIREKIGSDGYALDTFDAGLARIGWHEDLRQTGSLLRFTFRNVYVFEVAEGFPRLPDDYVPPLGVNGIKYSINVGSLPSLEVCEVQKILNLI